MMPSSPVPAAGDGGRKGRATTIAAETATGSHELVVQGYTKSKGALGVGRAMYSGAFAVGGHRWCIACYPDGESDKSGEHVAVFLLVDPAVAGHVTARFEFSLLDRDGAAVPEHRQGWTHTFSREEYGWGSELVRRDVLESSPYLLNDDSFRIRCDVTVVKEIDQSDDDVDVTTSSELLRRRRCAGDGGGATTIATGTVTGSHLLIVEGYSKTKGLLGVGRCNYSGVFTVAGHDWCVAYYPDGFDQETSEFISVFLHVDPAAASGHAVNARLKFSLLDLAGEPLLPYTHASEILTFSSTSPQRGFRKFISRKGLELSPYLKDDDSFKIMCEVTVLQDSTRTTTIVQLPPLPPSDLHQHLGDLLTSQVGADVAFDVGGETFSAHRNVLAARSPVFMAELYGTMRERIEDRVRIDDVEPGVFKAFLRFIYTDLLPEVDEGEKVVMAQHLLVAADRYGMERLKMICEHVLCVNIETNTAATTLALAEQHGCRWLKETCLKFIASPCNLKEVMAGDGFEHLVTSCPSLLKELAANIAA